jgi:FAD/FMN-containing dehydrogenase
VLVEGLNGKVTVFSQNFDSDAEAINKMALGLGGNVCGLLGSRLKSKAYNEEQNEIINVLNSIRSQFDPKGIMAPGIKF